MLVTTLCFNGIENDGIVNGIACCDQSCGQCGGAGCYNLPGGASKCCHGTISDSGIICQTTSDTGCIIPGKFIFLPYEALVYVDIYQGIYKVKN